MELSPYSRDSRRTVVRFHASKELKWVSRGYGLLARVAIHFGLAKPEAGIRGISRVMSGNTAEMPLDIVHKNTSLIKAAARLSCYSVGRSPAHIESIRTSAAEAQTVANIINGYFAERQPALPLEEIPLQPEEPVPQEEQA